MNEIYIDDNGNEILCQFRNGRKGFVNTVVFEGILKVYVSDGCDPSGKDLGMHPSGFHYVGNIEYWVNDDE
jgi:hypothetical protein